MMNDDQVEEAPSPDLVADPAEHSVVSTSQERGVSYYLDLLHQWFRSEIHGSPVSRDTASHNHLLGALPALAQRLAKGE